MPLSHPFRSSVLILSLFLPKSPSCLSCFLTLSELFLLYSFGDRAARDEHSDFGIQRQSIGMNRAILALLSVTASLIQPNISQDF